MDTREHSWLPDPAGRVGTTVGWLQGLAMGAVACVGANATLPLQSVVFLPGGHASDFAAVLDANVPACPLPDSDVCFAILVAHLEAFTEVA